MNHSKFQLNPLWTGWDIVNPNMCTVVGVGWWILSQPNLTVAVAMQCIGTHPTPPPNTQTFNCEYFSHLSTDWPEIFFRNPPGDDSNPQTTKKKLQLRASLASFGVTANISAIFQPIELNFFEYALVEGNCNVQNTEKFKLQLEASIPSFFGQCQYLSHFSTNWAEFFCQVSLKINLAVT